MEFSNQSNIAKSTVILVPVSSYIEPAVDESLRKLESLGYTVWRRYGWSAIDQGRCVLAQEALDKGFENLFWVDSDVNFWIHDVEKIIKLGLPCVSAPYSVKGWPVVTTKFIDDEIKLGEHGGLYECEFTATGFLYTHRSVYEKIIKHFDMKRVWIWGNRYHVHPFFYPLIIGDEYVGEDFSFCYKLRQTGLKIYSDTTVRLHHIGRYNYGLGFLQQNPPLKEPTSIIYMQKEDKPKSSNC